MATVDSQERYRTIAAEINGEPYTQPAESKITQGDIKIPYIAFESVQARSERHIRRLMVIIIILIVLLFASNGIWLLFMSGTTFETYEADVDAGQGDALYNYIGESMEGDITNYGTNQDKDEKNNSRFRDEREVQKNQDQRQEKAVRHLDIFSEVSNDDISATIDSWVRGSRNRQIMKDRLIDAMTYERIAEKHNLSVRYVKTLIYRLEMQVFEHLNK